MDLIGGAWTPEVAMFHKIYVKMKESGPLGGCTGCAPHPGSANNTKLFLFSELSIVCQVAALALD